MTWGPTNNDAQTEKPPLTAQTPGNLPRWFRPASATEEATFVSAKWLNEIVALSRKLISEGGISMTGVNENHWANAVKNLIAGRAAAAVQMQKELLWSGNLTSTNLTQVLNAGKSFDDYNFLTLVSYDTAVGAGGGRSISTTPTDMLGTTNETGIDVSDLDGEVGVVRVSNTSFKLSFSHAAGLSHIYGIKLGAPT